MDLYREPIKNTCPDIDKSQDLVRDAIVDLRYLIDSLEELRRSNGDLRDWGNKLVDRCKELEKEVAELESKNDELEYEMYELKNRD